MKGWHINMNLKQLESFALIIETQPTISSHISLLEKELNTQLLVRTTKDVHPTEDGKRLYTYAKQILNLQNTIFQEFNVKSEDSNLLTLGASTIPEQYILPEVLPRYIRKNKSELKILQGDSSEVINQNEKRRFPCKRFIKRANNNERRRLRNEKRNKRIFKSS